MASSLCTRSGARKADAWLVFSILIVVQILCFRGSTRLKHATPSIDRPRHAARPPAASFLKSLWKRSVDVEQLSPNAQHSQSPDPSTDTSTAAPSSTYLKLHAPYTLTSTTTANPDDGRGDHGGHHRSSLGVVECQPIPVWESPAEVCTHVTRHCEASGHIDYLRFYYCTGAGSDDKDDHHHKPGGGAQPPGHQSRWYPGLAALRAISLVIILSWMLFLFSWVGVVASDFFCPNLSTIASRLGLNESTAGVTFLAFGNGSPDVFSTFGAMKTGSGSLAIGELVGAASFIVSVISGSMMLIAPFRVKAWPFCRDVGFFTVAVALILTFLFDGKLRISECIILICLYVLYAATVIVGGWWQERRRQKRLMLAVARDEYDHSTGDASSLRNNIRSSHHGDLERSQVLAVSGGTHSPRSGGVSPSEYERDFDPFDTWAAAAERDERGGDEAGRDGYISPERVSRSGVATPVGLTPGSAMSRSNSRAQPSNRPGLVPRHSLLSAIEFRDVVHSLKQDASADRSMEVFQSWDPERFLSHRHHHVHQRGSSMDRNANSGPASPSQRRAGHTRVSSLGPGFGFEGGLGDALGDGRASPGPGRDRRKTLGSHDAPAGAEDMATTQTQRGSNRSSLLDVSAAGAAGAASMDDPWREHLPDDGCETLVSPALPLDDRADATLGPSELRRSLPKLSIPEWQTGFAQRSQRQGAGADSGDKAVRRTPSIPSIKISGDDGENADTTATAAQLTGKVRVRPRRGLYDSLVYRLRIAALAMFPTIRHIRTKSWVGVVISVLTAPAIMTLNLTLPVVDDEAARDDEDEGDDDVHAGALRLEGNEVDLLARPQPGPYFDRQEGEDDEAFEERIIHLRPQSPSGSMQSAEARVEEAERAMRAEHGQRDLDIASALRHLPENSGSPLSFGSGGGYGRKASAAFSSSTSPGPLALDGTALAADSGDAAIACLPCEEHAAGDKELRRSSRRFLALAQCVFAPSFVVWAITSSAGGSHIVLKVGAAAIVGLGVCLLSLISLRQKDAGKFRYTDRSVAVVGLLRCSLGFLVSVMWIVTIVDEVVSILQTVGLIIRVSDAILGLTVFAVGNSLGDLVANVTIARLGHPVMAISACFAGPLLNLLLGIGISGTWLLSGESSKQPWSHSEMDGIYPIDFSPTLLVSGLGLLLILVATLVAVPMNGFHLTRPLGVALISSYACIMTINVLTEIYWVEPHSFGAAAVAAVARW